MKTYKSPCVPALDALAAATAGEYRQGQGIRGGVDRARKLGQIQIPLPNGETAYCWINSPEAMSEVIREMLVLEADLRKLWGKK